MPNGVLNQARDIACVVCNKKVKVTHSRTITCGKECSAENKRRRKYKEGIAYRKKNEKEIKERNKKYRSTHKERLTVQSKIYVRNVRRKLIELIGNMSEKRKPICMCCGEDDLMYLQIDHVYNDGSKDKQKNNLYRRGVLHTRREYLKNPKRFQLLCANCNYAKHKNGGVLYKPKKRR